MKQLLFIHGGQLAKNNEELLKTMSQREINPFEEKKRRRLTLEQDLHDRQVIKPEMPNKNLANYAIWKMWFEKHIPFLDPEKLVIIGHSLGGMFLTKYFSENSFPFQIQQLHLIAPVLDAEGLPEGDNYLGDFAYELENIRNISGKAEHIVVWASKDDPVVPFHHGERIAKEIKNSDFFLFEDRGHFNQEHFPELIKYIKTH